MRFVRIALCLSTLLCCVCLSLIASPFGREHFVKKAAGFVVFPQDGLLSNIRLEKLQVIKVNIIRGLASPFEKVGPTNNLVTIYTGSPTNWEEQESKDHIVLKTSRLVATVPTSVGMGAVLFSDNNGEFILQAQPMYGRRSKPGASAIITYKSKAISVKVKPLPRRSKWIN